MNHNQDQSITVIILAAGMGTRMKSAQPKVMHAIANQPMIRRVVRTALELNASNIVTVIGPDMQPVADAVDIELKDSTCTHHLVVQHDRLGTGHAVRVALESFKQGIPDGKVLVLYGDTPLIYSDTLIKMIQSFDQDTITGSVVLGFRPQDPGKYGRLVTGEGGLLNAIIEYKDASDEERQISLCNSGVMAFDAVTLTQTIDLIDNQNASSEYYLTDMVAILAGQGKQSAFIEASESEVMGINDKTQLAQAEAIVQDRLRTKAMLSGVTLVAPETIFLSEDTCFGVDVTIQPHVFIALGVTIGDGVTIKAFSHLEQTRIDKGASVGPYSRLRPGSVIGQNAGIGNFVEIKNSNIAQDAKIGHLSYIGDADIGSDTNIGAGTITCNYDGYQKHKTTIGSSAFIGSNSIFIAPVEIGNNTLTAAGSVITKNVPDDALAVSRSGQKIYANKAKEIQLKKNPQISVEHNNKEKV
ncbi:MAG: bifunctional UDP-N-acetylglucosamine diphosphorylase/glucosamine-1-phosphate N-acetyltransferase GlmU [Rickettsiales bacterium]|nr:bifunctional UDP-N-acetylglucosamine diphosphorylase/glucosamine-1-phosphate N-acetyltransferase GlmU [Rickettsiales bacterium]